MTCKICQKEASEIFEGKILHKYQIKYFYCSNCGFLCTENPYWLKESYATSINKSDTGIMQRNENFSVLSTNIIYYFFDHKKVFLDYAGGYGFFVRLMRDIGFDFKWQDSYAENLVARGFEYVDGEVELITAFEVFEHFTDPLAEIEKILLISKNILFSTELLPVDLPKPEDWWYYGLNHGQHISFYSQKTFQVMAKKYGLNYYTNRKNFHLLTEKKINVFLFKILSIVKFGVFFLPIAKMCLKSRTLSDYLFLFKE